MLAVAALLASIVTVAPPTASPSLAGVSTCTFAGGDGTAGNPFQVATAAQLVCLRDDSSLWVASFRQTANITLSGTWSTGIGESSTPFTGTYDGSTNTIAGLSIVFDGAGQTGLFRYLGMGAIVRNLVLQNPSLALQDPGYQALFGAGPVVGRAQEATISHVRVDGGTISATGSWDPAYFVGGIVGYAVQSTLDHLEATGSIDLSSQTNCVGVGGIVGGLQDSTLADSTTGAGSSVAARSSVGGLVGAAYGSLIERSRSAASVSADPPGGSDTGGLVGRAIATEISESHATGDVSGGSNVGGLIGQALGIDPDSFGMAVTPSIFDSSAGGDVRGYSNVGGLVGGADAMPISASEASGDVFGSSETEAVEYVGGLVGSALASPISDSRATGAVSAVSTEGDSTSIGGLAGYILGNDIERSIATGSVNAESVAGLVGGVGGLVGNAYSGILSSAAHGSVHVAGPEVTYIGGLAGSLDSELTITDAYASGAVDAIGGSGGVTKVGGLAGNVGGLSTTTSSYSRGSVVAVADGEPEDVAGLVGLADLWASVPASSFFDASTATAVTVAVNGDDTYAAYGISTALMQQVSTYNPGTTGDGVTWTSSWAIVEGWEDPAKSESVWGICPDANDGYPFLLWEYPIDPCGGAKPTTTTTKVTPSRATDVDPFYDTATVSGTSGDGEGGYVDPTGDVQFWLCHDLTTATNCDWTTDTGAWSRPDLWSEFGDPVPVSGGTSATDGIATAVSDSTTGADTFGDGFYVFHASFSSGDTAVYLDSEDSGGSSEVVTVAPISVILAYTGPVVVYTTGDSALVTLTAQVSPNAHACPITFRAYSDGTVAGAPATVWTVANGIATSAPVRLPLGTYDIEVTTGGEVNPCAGAPDFTGILSVVPATIAAGRGGTGGGWYQSGVTPPKVGFGYTVQVTTTTSKVGRTSVTTTRTRGQLIWVAKNGWRLKGIVDYSSTDGSTAWAIRTDCDATTASGSATRCATFSGSGVLQQRADDGSWGPSEYGRVGFVVRAYDGGTSSVCKGSGRTKSCTLVELADHFGIVMTPQKGLGPISADVPMNAWGSSATAWYLLKQGAIRTY